MLGVSRSCPSLSKLEDNLSDVKALFKAKLSEDVDGNDEEESEQEVSTYIPSPGQEFVARVRTGCANALSMGIMVIDMGYSVQWDGFERAPRIWD